MKKFNFHNSLLISFTVINKSWRGIIFFQRHPILLIVTLTVFCHFLHIHPTQCPKITNLLVHSMHFFLCVGSNQAIPSSQEGSLSCNQSEHRIPLYCLWGLPAWLNLYDKIISYISVYMSISTNLKLLVREFMIYKSLNLVWLFLFAEWSITSLTTMSWLEKIWWWKT